MKGKCDLQCYLNGGGGEYLFLVYMEDECYWCKLKEDEKKERKGKVSNIVMVNKVYICLFFIICLF